MDGQRTTYNINEVFTDSRTAAAINALHRAELQSLPINDLYFTLMGLDNAGLIARYGKEAKGGIDASNE